jgi:hypothetical protein
LLLALAASGCTCKHAEDDHLSKESPATLKIDPPDDLDLPHSSATEALPSEAIPIYVSRSRIYVGFDRREVAVLGDRETLKIAGVPAKYKAADQSVTVIVDAVDALRKERKLGDWIPAAISFDASLPFHVIGDVVLTVQKARFDRYALVIKRDDGSLAAIGMGKGHQPTDTTAPPPSGPDADVAKDAAIYLGVRVVDDGYMMRAFNREVGPDCTSATFGTAVPKKNGGYDLPGLTHCAEVIRARVPDTHDKFVSISVAPAVPFSDVVRAIDALRTGGDGKSLFPDVGLTVVH